MLLRRRDDRGVDLRFHRVDRFQRGDARVAGQVEVLAVGDDRRVGPLRVGEDLAAAVHHVADRALVGELGDVDDFADRRERADHLAAGRAAPAHRSRPSRSARRCCRRRSRCRRSAGCAWCSPRSAPSRRSRRSSRSRRVRRRRCRSCRRGRRCCRRRRGRRRPPGSSRTAPPLTPVPSDPRLPDHFAGLRVDRVHVAAVVADVEPAAVVGGRRLDRAAELGRPADVPVDGRERVELAVFAAEVDAVADHHRR